MTTATSTPTPDGQPRSPITTIGRLACGCPDYTSSLASRRGFLKGLGVLTAGGVLSTVTGTVFTQTAFAASGQSDNILVVLSMRGGADGLSIVVPYSDPSYPDLRKSIAVPEGQLLNKDATFGLHPAFGKLGDMFTAGQMTAVHGVGLPVANRSHFSATEEVEDANPGSELRVGWINRMVGMSDSDSLFGAVQVSNTVPETEISGPQPTLATDDVTKIVVDGPKGAMGDRMDALDITWGDLQTPLGQAVRDGISTAAAWGPVLHEQNNAAQYPATDLGLALSQSAQVIRANVGAQVITVDHGSWDMHTNVGNADHGPLQEMVQDLSDSLLAFWKDIGSWSSNVTIVTISEFGRMLEVNGDNGLDHGWGNAMLVFGAGVNGGKYYTRGWTALDKTAPDLKVTIDYRDVLGEIVTSRFPDVSMGTLFPNFNPDPVGIMKGA